MIRNRHVWLAVVPLVVLVAASAARGAEKKFTCTRDVWVSAVPAGDAGEKEFDTSMGKTATLKLKTIQEMAILDFDMSDLKGKTVTGGWLWFHIVANPEEVKRLDLPFKRKHLLRGIGVSTVSSDWVEGASAQSYKVDRAGFGATFREASWSKKPWAWPGGDLTDVTFSNGNTLQCHANLEDKADMWARVRISPDLIRSLIVRDSYGWCVMDEAGYGLVNNLIHSREQSGYAPYVVVEVSGADAQPPAAPKVAVRAASKEAHLHSGAVAIDIAGPADAFCYFVKVNGKDVPRWRVPHPKHGKATVVLDDRTGAEAVSVEVVSCDAAGNRSKAAKAKGKASAKLAPVPKLPGAWKFKTGAPKVRSGKMRVWALPEICKVRPTNGALFEAKALKAGDLDYANGNSVWDGASQSVRVFGARGEIVAFQLCLERVDRDKPLTGITLTPAALAGAGTIAAEQVKLFRLWNVPMPEYPVPMKAGEKLSIPSADNKIRWKQGNQLVYVDVCIPQKTKAGDYKGKITIAADGVKAFDIPIALKVYDFAIPDKMRFNPELNIYRAPARPGSKAWFESFRVAHYNRCTLSITQAGHSDGIKTPLPLAGSGANVRVRDWSGWDKAYGPMLDGSAFKDLPRAGEPLATCQVPLSHGYPMPVDRYYKYTGPKKHPRVALIHSLLADPLETGFAGTYTKGFQNFSRQIVKHFEAKGWTNTYYMFYLDAKVNYRATGRVTSYWILDEPYNYDDWQALRFFGKLWRDAIKDLPKKTGYGYRCDISRPQWTRDWLNGVLTIMHVGGLTRKIKRVQIMAKEGPMVFYSYGSCNKPDTSNWNSTVWCLSTFLAGGDGVLPWQSLGRSDSVNRADPHGLIVPNVLGQGAVGSVRIRALRRGAQDCEYLLTLGEKYGYNREQLRALVVQKVAPKATLHQLHEDDAAPVTFGALDPDKFAELREGLAKLIVEKK